MSKARLILPLIVIIAAAVGCSSGNTTGAYDAEEVLESIRKSYQSTPDLNMKGDMAVSGIPVKIWFDAVIKQYDSLKLVMNGPFGIPVGSMAATPNHFLFLNLQENTAYEGAPTAKTFEKLIMMRLSYGEMVAMLRGEVPNFPQPGAYTVIEEDGELVYSQINGTSIESFRIDPTMPALLNYERLLTTGDTTLSQIQITYAKHSLVRDRYFAKKATVDISEGSQTLRIAFDRIVDSVNPEETCTITIPPGMERERM